MNSNVLRDVIACNAGQEETGRPAGLVGKPAEAIDVGAYRRHLRKRRRRRKEG